MSEEKKKPIGKNNFLKGPQHYQACQYVDCNRDLIEKEKWTAEKIANALSEKFGFPVTIANATFVLKSVGLKLPIDNKRKALRNSARIEAMEPVLAEQQATIKELLTRLIKLEENYQTLGSAHINLLARFNRLSGDLGVTSVPSEDRPSILPKSK